jgi:hypothetical protein
MLPAKAACCMLLAACCLLLPPERTRGRAGASAGAVEGADDSRGVDGVGVARDRQWLVLPQADFLRLRLALHRCLAVRASPRLLRRRLRRNGCAL